MKKKTIIFILSGLFFIAVITVVILIATGVFSSTTTTTPGTTTPGTTTPRTTTPKPPKNDCNKKPDDSKTYKLAYSNDKSRSQQNKNSNKYWWNPKGVEPIKCYLDITANKQVPSNLDQTNCSNYYAIGPDEIGYQCFFDKANKPEGCVVDFNGNSHMNNGSSCPNDYKESGPWPTSK